jgi:hypothetical protein
MVLKVPGRGAQTPTGGAASADLLPGPHGGRLRVAFAAALAATVGDLLMLWVGNATRPDLDLSSPPDAALWVGAVLGLIGLPVYGSGYLELGRRLRAHGQHLARVLGVAGLLGCMAGAGVHGYTALLIHRSLEAGVASSAAPAEAVLAGGPLLLSLWSITFVLLLTATVAFASLQVRRGAGRSIITFTNPVVLTIVLILVGATGPMLAAFLLPAAPNLAHVIFFGLLLREAFTDAAARAASTAGR